MFGFISSRLVSGNHVSGSCCPVGWIRRVIYMQWRVEDNLIRKVVSSKVVNIQSDQHEGLLFVLIVSNREVKLML